MTPRFYVLLALLLIPIQAALITPLSLGGIKPDLALACAFIIGLLAGPFEASLAGVGIGLLQDIASAGTLGLGAFSRGAIGLFAGLLGRHVLDTANPAMALVLAACSLVEGILFSFFWQLTAGDAPIARLVFTRMLPQALYTGVAGYALLHAAAKRPVSAYIRRRNPHKEF
jgi:rod shape-determining protein MreD